jgi:hypothetical protein
MSFDPVMVRVWNDNKFPYKEEFKERTIAIAAGKFIEMELMEATEFMGKFTPIKKDGDGQPIPSTMKMLRMERTSKKIAPTNFEPDLTCQACGFRGKTKKELDQHIDDNHMDALVDEKEKERRKEAKNEKGVLP